MSDYNSSRPPELTFPRYVQGRPFPHRRTWVPSRPAENVPAVLAVLVGVVAVAAVVVAVLVVGWPATPRLERVPYPVVGQFFVHVAPLPSPRGVGR